MAEFSIVPVGTGETSVSQFVAAAVNSFRDMRGLDFEVTPMSTVLVAEKLETILEAVRRAHEAVVESGAQRVTSTLKIDDRRDKLRTPQDKVEAVKAKLKPPSL